MFFKRKNGEFKKPVNGNNYFYAAGFLLALLLFTACREDRISVSRPLLGTVINITVKAENSIGIKAINSAFDEIARIQSLFSYYNRNTDIARLNRLGGQSMVELSPEVYNLLKL